MDELLNSIAAKKARLDAMRPVSRAALLALQKFYDVDLTYTSNAIEGNTLTLRETAEVIEHGITVGGKTARPPWKRLTTITLFCGCATWHLRQYRSRKQPCANYPAALLLEASPK